MNSPRNVIAIDRVPVSSLSGFQRVGTGRVKLNGETPWQPISIKVPARLTVSEKIEDGVRLHTAQLVFRTCEDAGDLGRWAYRCRTADGKEILIGTPERPYPVGTVTKNHPDNMSDSQLDEVTVTWTSSLTIPIIIG
jgi:hypothetical protein